MNKKKRDKLDKLWSEAVKIRAGNMCEYCSKPTYLNSHHIYSRSNLSTRYDLDNGVCLCVGCHVFSSKFSAHKTPMEFLEWIKKERGEKIIDRLRKKSRALAKFTDEDLIKIENELKNEINI